MYVLWLGIMLMAGLVIGFFAKKMMTSRAIRLAQQKAEALLNEAKQEAKDIMLDAKDKALKIIEEAKTEEKERRIQPSDPKADPGTNAIPACLSNCAENSRSSA